MNPSRAPEPPAPPEGGDPGRPPLGAWGRVYALVVIELLVVILLCAWLARIRP